MRVVCWNVNSLRVRLPRILALIERHDPDVICFQETKVTDDLFPREAFVEAGYPHIEVFGQKTYNGVAMVSKHPIEDVTRGFEGNPVPEQTRVISGVVQGTRILNAYVVNGEDYESEKFPMKMTWLENFRTHMEDLRARDPHMLVVGDFNVAPDEKDVYNPKTWRHPRIHTTNEERAHIQAIYDQGWTDVLRHQHPDGGIWTWWHYRGAGFQKDQGLRIDLALVTPELLPSFESVEVDKWERAEANGEGKPSDHAPLIVDLS